MNKLITTLIIAAIVGSITFILGMQYSTQTGLFENYLTVSDIKITSGNSIKNEKPSLNKNFMVDSLRR